MASEKVARLLDEIAALTLLEAKELADAFQEKFGVTAAAPVAVVGAAGAAPAGPAAAEEAAEPTTFDVILKDGGSQTIKVIKEVRAITGLALKEAKDLVTGVPKPVKEGVEKAEAEKIREQLEGAGAVVEIRPSAAG